MEATIDDDLVAKARKGDQSAVSAIIATMRGRVIGLMQRLGVPYGDFEDMLQNAAISIIGCIRDYRPRNGTKFTTYAIVCVRNELLRCMVDNPEELSLAWQATEILTDPIHTEAHSNIEVNDLLAHASHADLVREYFGIGGPKFNLNQIAARHRMTPKAVRQAIDEALAAMRACEK